MNRPALSKRSVLQLYRLYQRGYSINELAEIFGLNFYPIWSGFVRHGLKRRRPHGCGLRASIRDQVFDLGKLLSEKEVEQLRAEFVKLPKGRTGVRGYGELFVKAIYSDYMRNGESVAAVARLWNRSPGAIKEILKARGLRDVDPERAARVTKYQRVHGTGCFARMKRATRAQLEAAINKMAGEKKLRKSGSHRAASKFQIPADLKWEFRGWPMEKKAWFISRVREKLKSACDRPTTPFSGNVQPFDYATPAAREIQAKLNEGLDSRHALCKIDICTQGVIYKGDLFFWAQKTGYVSRGWTPERGRPLLNRLIWEEANGRKIPPSHVVRFIDGNPNNFLPGNLVLAHRNDVCRESQAKALLRKSRERTALLLQRAQRKDKHGLIEELKRAA